MSVSEFSDFHASTRDMLVRERQAVLSRMQNMTMDALNLELEQDGVPPSGYGRDQVLNGMLESRLQDIDNALARIEAGSYGMCADCANEIPPKRLQALPFATLCVRCQSEADKKARRKVRV
jgi:RNA polymerase-binding transcription factor DksA